MLKHLHTWSVKTSIVLAFSSLIFACGGKQEDYRKRDIREEVMYMVMPDRFANGDPNNDTGGIAGTRTEHGYDPADKAFHHGGDLLGVLQKLPYLQELGITAIWITPIFKNQTVAPDGNGSAYHGYWITDFTQVDPHFGTNDQLKKLIREAHKRDIKIFLDIVVNHTADIIRYEECHDALGQLPDGQSGCTYRDSSQTPYTPFLPEGSDNAKTPAWLNNVALYNNRGDSSFTGESSIKGDFFGLDDIDTTQAQVISGMTDIFKHWIQEYRIDGFRLDTARHVELEFWQQWSPEIEAFARQQGIKNFTLFAEVYDGDPRNVSLYSTEGKLDSALDFGLYFAMLDVFANNQGPQRIADILASDDWYRDQDSDANSLFTFVSNHDAGRLAHKIREANPEESNTQHLARMQLAYAFLYFSRGIPVLYYGDEQGFVGGGDDKLSREDMMPSQVAEYNTIELLGTDESTAADNFNSSHPMYTRLREYKKVLDQLPSLQTAEQQVRYADNEPGIIALSRIDNKHREYLVVFNTALESRAVTLPVDALAYRQIYPLNQAQFNADEGAITIELPALDFVVLASKRPLQASNITAVQLQLKAGQKVKGRYPVPVELEWASVSHAPLTRVEFYQSINGAEFTLAGRDTNQPFVLYPSTAQLSDGTSITWRAVAKSPDGESLASSDIQLTVGDPPGMRVTFKKPEEWNDGINIYYWNVEQSEPLNWPGTPMQWIQDDWYFYQFPDGVQQANLIFNDGQQQTADLYRMWDGCYQQGEWQDLCSDAPVPGLLLRFKKPASWGDNIHLYYWNAEPAEAVEWPGVAMQQVANGWYEMRLPANVSQANLIFNDTQGNQTDDLFRDRDGCFGVEDNATWLNQCEIPTDMDITNFSAHWVDEDTLVWNANSENAVQWKLFASQSAALEIEENDQQIPVLVGEDISFELNPANLDLDTAAKFRHLAALPAFSLTASTDEKQQLLRSQLVFAAYDDQGHLLSATYVQTPGAIDALLATNKPLGIDIENGEVVLRLWAPTAQNVELQLFDEEFNLTESVAASTYSEGVYTFVGGSHWLDAYYQYAVTAYHPVSNNIESYNITDPYSLNLSRNGYFSQIIDLANDVSLQPQGWQTIHKSLPPAQDITVYEGHVRSFSASDMSLPRELRGKYLAFTYNGEHGQPLSVGMSHLKQLQQAGLSHFHLMPVNDISTVNEDKTATVSLDDSYSRICQLSDAVEVQAGCEEFGELTLREVFTQLAAEDPVTPRIQAISQAIRTIDNFNWGYDPQHYLAVEGSYAVDNQSKARIREFREMVKGLHDIGLYVVVDVVFNHTSASGLWDNSVLDRAVPGYYHRRNAVTGAIETSTCCDNTAAEHRMMERLMVDAILLWARQYKIDAFRFDLMGHHPKAVMQHIKTALSELTLDSDGVDGARVYLYGEGWDFGEVSGNQRFEQATQYNMGGTGIGTFNDRIRAAVRGGNYSDNGRAQGFANGNGTYWNGVAEGAAAVNDQADRIRIGLAGNLRNYVFEDGSGNLNTGLGYSGVGYNVQPQENVPYVDKHDNETLWDNSQAKLPDGLNTEERVRVQLLSQSFVNYAQGVPFHQMGSDILRSKSLHRNTYDAGDWANQLDFSLVQHNWAKGLPEERENGAHWDGIRTILLNPNISPQQTDLQTATQLFQDQLRIRYSTPLFRLPNAEEVNQRVAFWNTGPQQHAGLIAMSISNGVCTSTDLDENINGLVVVFNSSDQRQHLNISALAGHHLELHAVQMNGVDERVKTASFNTGTREFFIPARSTAVFMAPRVNARTDFPCNPYNGQIQTPGFMVYVQKPSNWENLFAYFWNTSPAEHSVSWPGEEMQSIGDSWYQFQLPNGVDAANIIFHNNAGSQTSDLYRDAEGCFDIDANSWRSSCNVPGITLQFAPPEEWGSDVYLYFWNAAVAGPAWPGTLMQDRGDGVLSLTLPEGVRRTNVIFNDNAGQQTADLFQDKDACFVLSLGWQEGC
ncbi:Pullulanase [Thalassocella blandensis]|nr:Pullulanase [Thalassocella blandensis]